jgi:hypothetical protein
VIGSIGIIKGERMSIINNLPTKFIEYWTENVGELTLSKDYIDLQTGMKSHLHIYFEEGKYIAKMRYNEQTELADFSDLVFAIRRCTHGRDYMSSQIMSVYSNGFGELDDEKFC